jgi:hypothetical protein
VRLAARKSRTFPYGLSKVENLGPEGLVGLIFFTTTVSDALAAYRGTP